MGFCQVARGNKWVFLFSGVLPCAFGGGGGNMRSRDRHPLA